jgi:2-oxoglutarate ferredoxin oxidoreductase subunit beta
MPLINSIKKGLRHKGFSFIEVVGQCPTIYGRYCLGLRNPLENLDWLKKNSVTKNQADKMSSDELVGKVVIGDFVEKQEPTLEDRYIGLDKVVKST